MLDVVSTFQRHLRTVQSTVSTEDSREGDRVKDTQEPLPSNAEKAKRLWQNLCNSQLESKQEKEREKLTQETMKEDELDRSLGKEKKEEQEASEGTLERLTETGGLERNERELSVCIQTSIISEVCKEIFNFVHKLYIRQPHLVKVVHFQTYPLEALPLAMRAVPSMHICLSISAELLNFCNLTTVPAKPHHLQRQELLLSRTAEQQIFGLYLLAELSLQYPMPPTLDLAQRALTSLRQALSLHEDTDNAAYLSSSSSSVTAASSHHNTSMPEARARARMLLGCPAWVQMALAFPPLHTEVVSVLLGLRQESKPPSLEPGGVLERLLRPQATSSSSDSTPGTGTMMSTVAHSIDDPAQLGRKKEKREGGDMDGHEEWRVAALSLLLSAVSDRSCPA